jgi:50S ribosomal protein L16 3-hydroxylase
MKLELDTENFLSEYWQQKPLLIRNAVPNFVPPIDANELAGLAMEDGVESRIIQTHADNWSLHHGPFEETDFARDLPWTLLVQSVDHYVEDVANLLQLVAFIPNWRVDDVMVSYAVEGGSVGPHYDNYDVFLLQGEGTRQWRLGQVCDSSSELLLNDDLRILENFRCCEEYTLGPGDILYVPPRVAHWGIAQGECTTFSLGFRAPRVNDMLSRRVDEVLEQIDPEDFYTDVGLRAAHRAGEIRDEDLQRATRLLHAAIERSTSQRWFGELLTEPGYSNEITEQDVAQGQKLLNGTLSLVTLLSGSKLAWRDCGSHIEVYANGDAIDCPASVLRMLVSLCGERKLQGSALAQASSSDACLNLLAHLLNLACITIE